MKVSSKEQRKVCVFPIQIELELASELQALQTLLDRGVLGKQLTTGEGLVWRVIKAIKGVYDDSPL